MLHTTRTSDSTLERRLADAELPGALEVFCVGSAGGHLAQLRVLAPWLDDQRTTWVTFDLPDARSSLDGRDVVFAHSPTTRNVKNLLRNLVLAWRLVRTRRPDLIVSTGAAVALPFFLVGRLFGARTSYIEVVDRIDSRTLTGRLCRPFADLFLVQTASQQELYPEAVLVGRLL
jgi:UDP-N-acetylglucosamine:LPS N-acetylglucosamine transferase